MTRYMAALAVACLLATSSMASAVVLINDDFQTGMGAWSSTSWTRVDVGGGQYMLQATSGTATNPTKLPAAMQLDFDVQRTTANVGGGPRIYFHNRTLSPGPSKGYWISYLDDYNTVNDGLRITEKVADYGAETIIGVSKVTLDLNVHHVRLTDNGLGLMNVYFDNMTTPVLVLDDTASYSGADNTYIALGYQGRVDNIIAQTYVPEPVSLALLILSVPVVLLRRR